MSRRLVAELAVLAAAVLAALFVRGFVAAPFLIPSGSMLPTLMPGDIILVDRWRYGHLLPFTQPRLPARGDVAVFHLAGSNGPAYVKRVIGLPGDRVALADGVVMLNGRPLPRWRIADLVVPVTPNMPCAPLAGTATREERDPSGGQACRYPRYAEMLPGGRTYATLDITRSDVDDMAARTVPAGHLFMLGDHRDRSGDSRFRAGHGGVGMVPVSGLIGRARLVLLSTDGSAHRSAPLGWRDAVRQERTGRPVP